MYIINLPIIESKHFLGPSAVFLLQDHSMWKRPIEHRLVPSQYLSRKRHRQVGKIISFDCHNDISKLRQMNFEIALDI